MSRPSRYPERFRRDAVELVRSSPGRSLREIGRELGVDHETCVVWSTPDTDLPVVTTLRGVGYRLGADCSVGIVHDPG